MKTIWKKLLKSEPHQTIFVPKGAEILSLQVQHGIPCLWFMCDPTKDEEHRDIHIIGTGHEFDEQNLGKFIGTFQLAGGQLILHAFEAP